MEKILDQQEYNLEVPTKKINTGIFIFFKFFSFKDLKFCCAILTPANFKTVRDIQGGYYVRIVRNVRT